MGLIHIEDVMILNDPYLGDRYDYDHEQYSRKQEFEEKVVTKYAD
jgi:hypothetical protein